MTVRHQIAVSIVLLVLVAPPTLSLAQGEGIWFDIGADKAVYIYSDDGLAWEYFPVEFLQTRVGYRLFDGIPQNSAQNREQLFAELHVSF